jgi:hypothetical protein
MASKAGPSWAAIRAGSRRQNLTPHAQGLAGWKLEQFDKTLRTGIRPDGTPLRLPMTIVVPYAQRMTDTEVKALWAYISTVEPKPTGK